MDKPTTTELNCIDYFDTLYALQKQECTELGIPIPQQGQCIALPDGRDDIKRRLHLYLSGDQWGNQRFNNDSFYRVPFEEDENGEVYEDDLTPDMKLLLNYCKDALNVDVYRAPFLLFYICW